MKAMRAEAGRSVSWARVSVERAASGRVSTRSSGVSSAAGPAAPRWAKMMLPPLSRVSKKKASSRGCRVSRADMMRSTTRPPSEPLRAEASCAAKPWSARMAATVGASGALSMRPVSQCGPGRCGRQATVGDGAGEEGGELGLGAAEALHVRGGDVEGDGDAGASLRAHTEAAVGAAGEGEDGLRAALAGKSDAVAGEREGDRAGD